MFTKTIMQILLINCQLIILKQVYSLPLVETKLGFVYGVEINNLYVAYRGIPFAEVPRGALRFAAPQALSANWSATLNARFVPNKCLQWQETAEVCELQGSEDCLYLNIFVPLTNKKSLLPVLVFIHGGGFMWGSADFYAESYIMEEGAIILVTMNYRLGVFGFLSTEDEQIAGNMGLKDQSLAIKWIHDNIYYFGGDPDQVLLSGWSAGGASVNYHMVSEMTSPQWFSSAASFSGSALCACHAIYPGEALKLTKRLVTLLNSTATNTQRIKLLLQNASALDIMAQVPKFYKFLNHPFIIFQPVLERTANEPSFLKQPVVELLRAGKAKQKPYLLAHTAEDGAFGAAEFLLKDENGDTYMQMLNEKWLEVAPTLLFFNSSYGYEQRRALAANIKSKYFGDSEISVENYRILGNLLNEELGIVHMHDLAELSKNFTKNSTTFGYIYDNEPPVGLGQIIAKNFSAKFGKTHKCFQFIFKYKKLYFLGTVHGDDIFLLFKTDIRYSYPLRADEKLISQELIKMLVSLAKTGQPTYNGTKLADLTAANSFQFERITKAGVTKSKAFDV